MPCGPDAEHQVAEIVAQAAGAAEQLAAMQHAEAERLFQRHQHHVVEIARLAEPVMGQRDGMGIALDDGR